VFRERICITAAGVALAIVCSVICSSASATEPLPDPTRPVLMGGVQKAKTADPKHWQLTSVLISAQRRVAVINDQVVRIGQNINGAKLLTVEPGSALLSHAGRRIRLELIAEPVKRVVAPAL